MNRILEKAIEEARSLPAAAQEEVGEIILSAVASRGSAAPQLTSDQIAGVVEAQASTDYADPNDVQQFFRKARA